MDMQWTAHFVFKLLNLTNSKEHVQFNILITWRGEQICNFLIFCQVSVVNALSAPPDLY